MEGDETRESCRKVRVVIVGAGVAGLSAARRLKSMKNADFELIVLEGSDRIGGRVCSTEFAGERVELGATWIHGIDGSPLYDIAEKSGALKGDLAWECMDGLPACPIVKAEGGCTVDRTLVDPVMQFYNRVIDEAKNQLQEVELHSSSDNGGYEGAKGGNLGAFLRARFTDFIEGQEKTSSSIDGFVPASYAVTGLSSTNSNYTINSQTHDVQLPIYKLPSGWSLRSLLEGVFSIQENSERSETAADSLHDLDLSSFGEYWDLPGKQITIAKGFSSVTKSLCNIIPPDSIRLKKRVEFICWSDSANSRNCAEHPVQLHCQDGSTFEADHVIITVSLGVLKAGVLSNCKEARVASQLNDGCKTKQDLQTRVTRKESPECDESHERALFQPPLPDWKVGAIKRLGFGVVDKVFVLMEPLHGDQYYSHMQFIYKTIYDEEKTVTPSWMRKTYSVSPIHSRSRILLAWFVGKEALQMEAMTEGEIIKAFTSTFSEFGYHQDTLPDGNGSSNQQRKQLPKANGECKFYANGAHNRANTASNISGNDEHCSIKHTKWGTDPLFLGSYSYIAAGSSGLDMDVLAEPIPRDLDHTKSQQTLPALQLLFAGEATHRYHYSTTHGAYFSGLREADRLLAYYGYLN